jgi:hypothetical protein
MIQAYDTYPFPKSMPFTEVKDYKWADGTAGWPEGTKIEDGGGAWVVMVPVGEPFEGSIKP